MKLFKTIPLLVFIMLLFFMAYHSIEIKPRVRQWQEDLNVSFLYDSPSLLREGKLRVPKEPYLLHVFSSWCASCKDEHLALVTLQKFHKVKIIGLAWNDQKTKVEQILKKLGNPFTDVATLNEQGFIRLGVISVPETFLVDEEGKVILKISGAITKEIFTNDILPKLK